MRVGTMSRDATAATMPHMGRNSWNPGRNGTARVSPDRGDSRAFSPLPPGEGRKALLLLRALPALYRRLAPARDRELARRCVGRDRGARADRRVAPDRDRGHERGVRADERAVLDPRDVLVRAVVVASDRSGADVDAAADLAVAEVAQVVGLRAA